MLLVAERKLVRKFGLERRVARHERDAAGLEMILQRGVEQLDRSGVERDLWLVEQPDRARRGEQARERQLPLLACREETGGKLGKGLKPEGGKRAVETSAVLAKKLRPKGEVLAHAEARLHRVQMADIVAKLRQAQVGRSAVEAQAPGGKRQQPGDLAQQAGLAGAVGPAHQQSFPGSERETQAIEDGPAAALAAQVVCGEADPMRHLLRFCAS